MTTATPRRHIRTRDAVCAAAVAGGLLLSYVFAVLTPSLLRHHVLLVEALTSSVVSIVTGGVLARTHDVGLPWVILAPLAGIALFDVFWWWAGRLWGTRLAAFYTRGRPRTARRVARAEDLVRRRGVVALAIAYYLPLPNPVVYVTCGVSEMPLWTFVLGDAIGTLLWEAALIGLGWSVGHSAIHTIDTINHHAVEVTLGGIGVWLVVTLVWRRLRAARRTLSSPRTKEPAPGCDAAQ